MELTSEQNSAIKNIVRDVDNGRPFITMGGYAGTGKQQPIDCLVQTPMGPRKIGDLKEGDYIFGIDGKPIKVLGVFPQGIKQSYKIKFRDKSYTEAGEDHLWKVIQGNKTSKIISTHNIINLGIKWKSGNYRFKIPLCKPVEYKYKNLPLNPYLLGVFIGDGTSLGRSPTVSTPDIDKDIIKILEILKPKNIIIKDDRSSNCPRYGFRDFKNYRNSLASIFKELGLDLKSPNRFIPSIYKYSSINQRYELLRGLMDTDGSCRNNRTSFSTSSKELKNDVIELVQSLGGTAIKSKDDERAKNTNFNINIKTLENPFKIDRKAKEWFYSHKNPPSRFITSIEKSRIVQQTCISVDSNDGIYLTDNYIVTHNTTVLTELRRHLDPSLTVAFASFTGKASSVLRDKILRTDSFRKEHDYVGTIHGLMYQPVAVRKWSESKGAFIETVTFKRKQYMDYDIIMVDEGSMVGSRIFDDMMEFGVQIVVCGDSFQLSPVGDTEASVVTNPDYLLSEIHRTAQDSSLVKLSHAIRTKQYLPQDPYRDDQVQIINYFSGGRELLESLEYDSETVTLCFTNAVRQSINFGYRTKKAYNSDIVLYPYEQIVCISNNQHLGMMNGERFTIEFLTPPYDAERLNITVERQDGTYQEAYIHNTHQKFGKVNKIYKKTEKIKLRGGVKVITDPEEDDPMVIDADYGYAMTVHKSQGSEFKHVVLVDSGIFKGIAKSKKSDDYLRWLYTGVTRSSEKLTIITDYPNA